MKSDLSTSRRDSILKRLTAGQSVRAATVAAEFGVSEDAIRRDLRSLAADGLCRRVYGGAVPLVSGSVPMAQRVGRDVESKQALAVAAVQALRSGDLVFLDNGSANLALAERLPVDLHLTVATGSVAIASALSSREDIDLILVGGAIDRVVGGAIDGTALETVGRLNIDLCVLGACALSSKGGISAFEAADAAFKRALIARSDRVIALVTSDKLGRSAPHRIVAVDELDGVVVENNAPVDVIDELERAGAKIIRAVASATR